MGVFGLLSHCLEHREQCVEYVDLVEVARERGGIELLVDFYSFEHLLLNNLWKSLSSTSKNPYIRFLGGEYTTWHEFVKKLILDLKSLDIHLVMFVDGAKGSSKVGTEQKMETWKFRHDKDMEKMKDIVDVLNSRKRIEDLSDDTNVRPVLLEVQIFETLKECNCSVIQCSTGEADYVLARNLQNRPKAFAILSNDSDFCIFKNSRFIPNQLFDIQNDLQLGQSQIYPEKPVRLMMGVISSMRVISLLGLRDEEELMELGIISGNDFTTQYVKKLKGRVGIKNRQISDAARWILEHRKVENHPVIRKEMDENRAFAESVTRSRQFYTLSFGAQDSVQQGLLWQLLDEGVQRGEFPANIMAMHQGFYWHRMLLEDCEYGAPCIETTLADLRKFVYRIIMDPSSHTVVEYGRSPYEQLSSKMVHAMRPDRFLDITNFQKDKIFQSLRTFHRCMTHLEPGPQNPEWYKRYGWRVGFIFYVLRYFLVLNTGYNLHMTMDEFMPLIGMVFCKFDEKWYQSLNIRPSMRCVTIGNHFQDVYRHAFYFLGKLFYLSKEFPQPMSMFSGSVWTAFYMMSVNEGQLRRQHGLDVRRIHHDMNNIIKEKRHMLKYVLEGYYDLGRY